MKNILAATATLLALAVPTPALADSYKQINEFVNLIEKTGTDVVSADCKKDFQVENAHGFYLFDKEEEIDHLVICKDTVAQDDPEAIWETLAHEATHVMQHCLGGPIINDSHVPRMLRNLKAVAPHYYEILQEYDSDKKRIEIEAFDMELQDPQEVVNTFKYFCFSDN